MGRRQTARGPRELISETRRGRWRPALRLVPQVALAIHAGDNGQQHPRARFAFGRIRIGHRSASRMRGPVVHQERRACASQRAQPCDFLAEQPPVEAREERKEPLCMEWVDGMPHRGIFVDARKVGLLRPLANVLNEFQRVGLRQHTTYRVERRNGARLRCTVDKSIVVHERVARRHLLDRAVDVPFGRTLKRFRLVDLARHSPLFVGIGCLASMQEMEPGSLI